MKQNAKKGFAFLLAFVMVFALVGVQMPVTTVQAATKMTMSCITKTVAVGGKYTLTVQGVTDKKATYAWSSSDKKVATVSKKGVVTGVTEGSATIQCKVTLSDKSTQTLSCKVTVKEQIAATSVKISNANLDENKVHTIAEGESYDFNRKLSPSKSNDKTYWYIQDEEYAEVNSGGVVTAKKAGTTMLIAKVGIDRISAEEATNKVVASIRLNIVEPVATNAKKFTYTIKEDGTVCITGYDKTLKKISIPRRIEGKLVTEIGENAFYYCETLESVKIPNSVTTIGDSAFRYCKGLKSIEISNSVTTIGDSVFYGCKSLESIEMSNSVTTIGLYAFSDTPWLNKQLEENPFVIVNNILIKAAENSTEISNIPNSVTSIGERAFSSCKSLKSVEIPNSVTSIGEGAFYNCENLKSIELPNNLMTIGDSVFGSCKSLKSIEIPNSVISIGEMAFANCVNLDSINIPNSVTSIGEMAFDFCINLESIKLSSSLTRIEDATFSYCESLESIEIPNGVISIGNEAFWGCIGLKSIEIPNSVTSIGRSAFWDCNNLKSIKIPNSVTSIGQSAFAGCYKLDKKCIPSRFRIDILFHDDRLWENY